MSLEPYSPVNSQILYDPPLDLLQTLVILFQLRLDALQVDLHLFARSMIGVPRDSLPG